jgi:sulfide:quinone oxidoreductase
VTKKVVVLGGGVGGTMVANSLAKGLKKDEVEITIVDEDGKHVYQPGFVYISFGNEKPHKIVKDERKLLRKNVNLVVDKATKIDVDDRRITTSKDKKLEYDHLVLATGAEIHPEEIAGSEDAHHFYDTESSVKLRKALSEFNGGKIVTGIGGVPYKCPPAPAESACLMDYYFHKRGIRDKVELKFLSPLLRIFPIEPIDPLVSEAFEMKNIKSQTFFNVESVEPEKKLVHSLEGESVDYDLLILVPPHKGAKVIRATELCDRGGWIITDRQTLKVLDYDDVYAIGDATNLPVSKSGAAAHYENSVVSGSIIGDIRGTSKGELYDGRVTCFCDAGFGRGIMLDFDYEHPPVPPPFSRMAYFKKILFNKFYWWILPKDRLPGFVTGKLE